MKKIELDNSDLEFMNGIQINNKKSRLNPDKHNITTKRYAKLSLSLTDNEKEAIRKYKDKHYERMSISSMIMAILDEKDVFK